MKLLPLVILGGIGFALYKASTAQAQPSTATSSTPSAPRTTTNPNLVGLNIPRGLTLSSEDTGTLRALLKTDATGALRDIYGTDDASARLRFAQVIVDRMAQDRKPAYETIETVLREFYTP